MGCCRPVGNLLGLSGQCTRAPTEIVQSLAKLELLEQPAGAAALVSALSGAIFREGDLDRINRLFARVSDRHTEPARIRLAIIRGIEALARQQLPDRPEGLSDWEQIADLDVRTAAIAVAGHITWPGKEGRRAAVPLSAEQRIRVEAGRREYARCSTCHLPSGLGMSGLAHSLVDSPWITGQPEALALIVLHGKQENTSSPPMPPFSDLGDEQIATILTYIRHQWGHSVGPVDAGLVGRIRRATRDLQGPLTRPQIEALSAR